MSVADRVVVLASVALVYCCYLPAAAEPVETEMPGVTAELIELRLNDNVVHLGVRLSNTSNNEATGKDLLLKDLALIETGSKTKYLPLRGADEKYLGGPISDWRDGGRWGPVKLPARTQAVIWAYFDPLPLGTKVQVNIPGMFPFDNVAVTGGGPALSSQNQSVSALGDTKITLVSSTRADGQLQLRARMSIGQDAARYVHFEYQDVFFFAPATMRKYPVLKGDDGNYAAQPFSDRGNGGRYSGDGERLQPGATVLMSMTFQAPPDNAVAGDILIPGMAPIEAVAISGQGNARAGGIEIRGQGVKQTGVAINFPVVQTPTQTKATLPADVLFDFDKSDLKPVAEPALQRLLELTRAQTGAIVVEGHTDSKGSQPYNLNLSQRRADSVKAWLVARGTAVARISTRGWGASKPEAPNAKPDGSDDPDGRQKNRRVTVTINAR
jgi:outer membrane protein OmpA-like peptidoglycan-associated protein